MRFGILFLGAFLFFKGILFATKPDTLVHLSYAQRRPALRLFYTDELTLPQRSLQQSQLKVKEIHQIAKEANDRDLELEAVLMHFHVELAFKLRSKDEILISLDSLYRIAEKENVSWLRCRIQSLCALTCFIDEFDYEKAFQYAEMMHLSLQTVSKNEFPEKQISYYQIAYYYYQFHDWENALRYCQLALKETPVSPKDQYQMLICNMMGLIQEKHQRYDSAIWFYRKSIESIVPNDATQNIWVGILKGNIGNCLYHKKQFAEARPLLQVSIDSGFKYQEPGIVSDAYLTLGMIALDEGELNQADFYIKKSRFYCNPKTDYSRFEKLYPVLANLARKQGDIVLMGHYLDSAMVVKDSMARKLNALYILRGSQKVQLLKEQKLNAEKQIKTQQRNFLIALIVLVTLLGMYIFYTQRRRFQQKRAIDELQLQQSAMNLKMASEKLHDFAFSLSEKSALIEELERKLQGSPNMDALIELKESTILTDEEWDRFRRLFDQVHKGFTIRLKEKLPDLTQAETRFMVLAKLKFSNKEMAAALNISTQAIRTTWYRLRKKLNLPEEGSLDELVENI